MKFTKKNYLIYLVIFTIILLLFFYLLSDKDALIKQLYKEFNDTDSIETVKEGAVNFTDSGLDWVVYEGYYNDPIANTSGLGIRYSGKGAVDLSSLNTITGNLIKANDGDRTYNHNFTIILTGYFVPNKTGNWGFRISSDDASFLWLGKPAINGWTALNAVNNDGGLHPIVEIPNRWNKPQGNTVYLIANEFYPIRIQMGEKGGGYNLTVQWTDNAGYTNSFTSNGYGVLFSPSSIVSTSQSSPEKGLTWRIYEKYFNDDVKFSSNPNYKFKSGGMAIDTGSISSITQNKFRENMSISGMDPLSLSYAGIEGSDFGCYGNLINPHQFSMELTGYFYTYTTNTDPTKSWEFYITSDDASYLWIGDQASVGWSRGNATIDNGGLHGMRLRSASVKLTPNTYFPIRLQFGENCGGYNFRFAWKPPNGNWTTNGNGYLYSSNFNEVNNDHMYYGVEGPKIKK